MQSLREGTQVSDTVAAHGDPQADGNPKVPPQCLVTLSFYLRDSAASRLSPSVPGYTGFSRAASAHSPCPHGGRLRVLLLRQTKVVFLWVSIAVIPFVLTLL